MDINALDKNYAVRPLVDADIPALLALCQDNPQYYQYCPPEPSEASLRADMRALPPGKGLDDKYYLGFFDGAELVAVMDLILRYPNPHTAFIGFFMMNASRQGSGLGTAIITDVLAHLSGEFSAVRLAYVQGNEQSKHFWHKNGFGPTGVIAHGELYDMVVMEREI